MTQTPPTTFDFQKLFENALKEYEGRAGTKLLEHELAIKLGESCDSADSVIEVLQAEAHKFQKFRGDGKVMKWLNRTVQVLYTLSTSPLVGQGVSFVPFPPAQAIFAGIGVLLSAIKDVSASYDALVDLFESMESFLRRLNIYAKIPPTSEMTEIFTKILIEFLSTLALGTQQAKQGRLKKLGKKLFGENDIEAVLQRFDRLTKEEARFTAAQTLEVAHRLVRSMNEVTDGGKVQLDGILEALVVLQKIASNMNKEKRDEAQRISRQWLSPPNPSINHNTFCKSRHDGTAVWFIHGNTFPDWIVRGSLLWIYGKPGSGKSVLCSAIIQDIKVMREAGLASLAYFYFDFRDTTKKGIRGILTSLLVQLSAISDPCCDILSSLYSRNDCGLQQPSEETLTLCLKEMLTIPTLGPMYIIVDGIDECPNTSGSPSPRESVLDLLSQLVQLRHRDLHIWITSRPEPDIEAILRPLSSHCVSLHDESGQNQDIIDYVKATVGSDPNMKKWPAVIKQLVIDTLSQRVDGMFRWVFCQLDTLRRCPLARIRRTLKELPGSLDETYQQALESIDNEKWECAHRLFQCIAVASRPLRVKELAEFLAIDLDADQKAVLTIVEEWRPEDPTDEIRRTCSSLITIVEDSGIQIVQFSHFSVKEFLTSSRLFEAKPSISRYFITLAPAHTIIAKACLSLLLQLEGDKHTISGRWPLANYSAQHWVGHAQFEDVSLDVRDAMESLFDPYEPYFAIWVSMWDVDQSWYTGRNLLTFEKLTATSLYYAALCGFCEVVEWLVTQRQQDVHAWGGRRATPLHAVSTQGHLKVAQSLLNRGASVNGKGNSDHTPLHAAAKEGHSEIATLLLKHGADANARNANRKTPLLRAAKRGHLEVARALLVSSADVQARDKDGQTALHLAAMMGHLEVTTLLLERGGARVNAKNNKEKTPLLLAAEKGHSQVARALLKRSAYVQARDEDGQTALHLAATMGHSETAMLLLEHGANVNAQNTDTALLVMDHSAHK